MLHFYEGQVRKFLTQFIRILSNFSVETGKGKDGEVQLRAVPVVYGDPTRQVASIIRQNSENALQYAPKIACYVRELNYDRERMQNPYHIEKQHLRERDVDSDGNYTNQLGAGYTVEKVMPSPFRLQVTADIFSSNTDQKLQLLEQILVLFNPSLEMQTTDNFIDWTSISVINLENVTWSNRSVPVGVDSEIDICTMTFSIPIYISPPTKVRKMGVITNIITSMFDETLGTIEDGVSKPILNAYDDVPRPGVTEGKFGRSAQTSTTATMANVNYATWGAFVNGTEAQLFSNGMVGNKNWREIFEVLPGTYAADVSRIYFTNSDNSSTVTGTFTLSPFDEGKILINWDADSFPSDTVIAARTSIDYIIDPTNFNPTSIKASGIRILLLDDVGNAAANFSPSANDLVEWDGAKWNIVFDASAATAITYTTNLNTSVQYRYNNNEWLLSVDGDYPVGTWRVELAG